MIKSHNGGLASIIIPCWNQLAFTRHCVQSVFLHTRLAFELIVVDNGLTDGTGGYLAGVADAAPVPVTVIANSSNQGFPAAINQGLRAARGGCLVLLNNDVVVTDGWLDQLVALAEMRTTEGDAGREETTESTERIREGTTKGTKYTKDENGTGGRLGIGLVGPMSNYAVPPQLVGEVGYRDLEEMQAFARRWREEHRGQWFMAAKLSGFCLLMKRDVYEAVGGLDERFGMGFFDDDDLALRARQAGFELAVAHDLFVHHFGSRTFAGNGVDADGLLEENGRRFAEKWGAEAGNGQRVMLRAWDGNSEFHAKTQGESEFHAKTQRNNAKTQRNASNLVVEECADPQVFAPFASSLRLCVKSPDPVRTARVCLTMIVKNEQENLPACLESVRGLFDEIVVVDTGSTDRTKEIARELGAKVFDFEWVDDFAVARNEALARATGDYAFWLDADDVVEPAQRGKLEALFGGLRRGEPAGQNGGFHPPYGNAYVMRCACDPGANGDGGQTVVDHIRLFPLRDDVRWCDAVHEQILPSLPRASIPVQWTEIVVRHTGYVDPALRDRKLERDMRILQAELVRQPDDPFVLFNLGSIAIERQDWREALVYLNRSLAGSAPTDSITRKLYALIARAHQMLEDPVQALAICAAGLRIDPDDAELTFREAVVRHRTGDFAGAERCWRRVLTLRRPQQFVSMDMGIYGHLTRRNLAVLAEARGDLASAAEFWRGVLAECPADHDAMSSLRRLGAGLLPA